jgi:hypothetical protein
MTNSKQYKKDLTKITSVRLSPNLLNEGIQCADSLGLSFSDFIRQSLIRNISVLKKIEKDSLLNLMARKAENII